MSGGSACVCINKDNNARRLTRQDMIDLKHWRVLTRYGNHSAFSGYKFTPSDYSSIKCLVCKATWRTKAGYVVDLQNFTEKDL